MLTWLAHTQTRTRRNTRASLTQALVPSHQFISHTDTAKPHSPRSSTGRRREKTPSLPLLRWEGLGWDCVLGPRQEKEEGVLQLVWTLEGAAGTCPQSKPLSHLWGRACSLNLGTLSLRLGVHLPHFCGSVTQLWDEFEEVSGPHLGVKDRGGRIPLMVTILRRVVSVQSLPSRA